MLISCLFGLYTLIKAPDGEGASHFDPYTDSSLRSIVPQLVEEIGSRMLLLVSLLCARPQGMTGSRESLQPSALALKICDAVRTRSTRVCIR